MRLVSAIARSLPLTIVTIVLIAALAIVPAIVIGRLTTVGAISLYFIAWWTMLFSVLSLGTAEKVGDAERAIGADAGAPANPLLREKAIITSVIADAALAVAVVAIPLVGL